MRSPGRSGTVEGVIAVGVKDPEEALSEHADLAGAVSVPVANHRNIARDSSIRERLIATSAVDVVEDAVAVSV